MKKKILFLLLIGCYLLSQGNITTLVASPQDTQVMDMKTSDSNQDDDFIDAEIDLDPSGIKKSVNLSELENSLSLFSKASSQLFIYSSQNSNKDTLNLYNIETLKYHTYIPTLGYLMEYLGINSLDSGYYDIRFQGGIYAIHSSDVEKFIPLENIRSFPYYMNENGIINHYIEGNPLNENSWYFHSELGKAPNWMEQGKKYYSFSGIYFTDTPEKLGAYSQQNNAVNANTPYYDYYLFQPLRTETSYSRDELNGAFNHFYELSSVNGRQTILANQGDSLKSAENLYGTNALMILSLGIHEGAYGTSSISLNKNNPFGYAAYDSNTGAAKPFDSVKHAIEYVAGDYLSWVHADPTAITGSNYYGAHFGNKSSGINVKYASDPFWGEKNANIYAEIDRYLGEKDYQKYGLAIAAQESTVYWSDSNVNKAFTYKKSTSLLTYMYPVVIHNTQSWSQITMEPPFDSEHNIDWHGRYNWNNRGYVNKENLIIVNSPKSEEKIIHDGNYVFYLNQDGTISFAEEIEAGKRIAYYEYYANAKYGVNHGMKIKNKYIINGNGEVIKAEERKNDSRSVLAYYEYYPGAILGQNHGVKIRYKYSLNTSGELIKAEERADNNRTIISIFEYYPGAKHGINHGTKIKYKYSLNSNGEIFRAEERRNDSRLVASHYEYYNGAKYGENHGLKIKYKFLMDENSFIIHAEARDNNSRKIKAYYYYQQNTKYGNHGESIKEVVYV